MKTLIAAALAATIVAPALAGERLAGSDPDHPAYWRGERHGATYGITVGCQPNNKFLSNLMAAIDSNLKAKADTVVEQYRNAITALICDSQIVVGVTVDIACRDCARLMTDIERLIATE